MTTRRSLLMAAGGLPALSMPMVAIAADWLPNRPIRLIVPFVPGGATDVAALILADAIAEPLRQPMVVENRGGAGGNIGGEAVARATPDGYTLLLGMVGLLTTNPFLYEDMGFNPMRAWIIWPSSCATRRICTAPATFWAGRRCRCYGGRCAMGPAIMWRSITEIPRGMPSNCSMISTA